MKCRHVASDLPRLVCAHPHERGERCEECLPCRSDHCRCCYTTHVDGLNACPGCLAETREALADIARMTAALPAEVIHRGVDSEAANLYGPSADPEARGYWEASVLAGRIVPPDCDARELDDVRKWLETADDERHPLLVLGTWGMVYRDAFEHDEPTARVDVATEAGYLARNLGYMATWEWVDFAQFAKDLRTCRAHMEAVLHDGEQIELGAPCPTCKRKLTHVYGKRLIDDRWICENKACDVDGYTTAQYRGWVEDDALHGAKKLTAADMARRFVDEHSRPLVTAGEVRVWGSKEYVRKRGTDHHGITLYDVSDVEKRVEARLERQTA